LYHRYTGSDPHLVAVQSKIDEIAKVLLHRVRDADRANEWQVVVPTLENSFLDEQAENNKQKKKRDDDDKEEEEGDKEEEQEEPKPAEPIEKKSHMAEVSKWIAASYGPSPSEDLRKSMVHVVQECIIWVFAAKDSSRLGFLGPTALMPISNKIIGHEAEQFLSLLEAQCKKVGITLDKQDPATEPYFVFKETLERIGKGQKAKTPGKSTSKRTKTKARAKEKVGKLDLAAVDDSTEGQPSAKKKKESQEEEPEEEAEEPAPLRRSPRKSPQKSPQTPARKPDLEEETEDLDTSQPEAKKKKGRPEDDREEKEEEEEKKTPKRKAPSSRKKSSTKKRTTRR
jgi:hypothetical protein